MAHTPLPWKRIQMGYGSIITADAATPLSPEPGLHVLDIVARIVARTDWGRGAEDEDNAEYIEHACNAFGPLLELTESLLKFIENDLRRDNDTQEVMRQVRIALNRVKERAA